jgi:glycosyltransferase involved in cell wall biosynthesis
VKILVLNYEYPPVGGGGGRACATLCQALVRRGHQVRVITSRAAGLPRREEEAGVSILRVPTGRRNYSRASLAAMVAYLLSAFFPALISLRRWRPDLLHVHFAVPTGALAPLLSRLSGVPYVLTAHLGDVPGGVEEKTGRWFRYIGPFTPPIWKRAAAVVAVSEHTRKLALAHYPVRIEVIPNGEALPPRDPGRLEVGRPPRILFAGRFQAQKNLSGLLRALAGVRDLTWTCDLYGDGPQRAELEGLRADLKLQERVRFHGWVEPRVVMEAMEGSDLLAMPSQAEGLPVVAVQALAQGLAIVATAAGGLAEVVKDGVNGRLVPVGDMDAFVGALRWCLEDEARLLNLKRASLVQAKRFDIEDVAARYEELFRRVSAP